MTTPIRLLIVDDHPIVRNGLVAAFTTEPDIEVVAEASNGLEALEAAKTHQIDVALMDLRMPEMDGVQATRALRQDSPNTRVLVLTTFDTDSDVLPAIEAGATGYLLKDAPPEDVLKAIRAAAKGESILSPTIAGRLLNQVRRPTKTTLSKRELEVLTLVAEGATNREAARRLFISEASIKTHLLHIYAKLNARDRAAAVATAYRQGLL
ncbi:DNA-binding NarL/FixJ family response regulator [Crossiella equi]|uniref:DNA-binding NarL/FixJ family response regulator n=1 Tax=Crossiella equi TaxID=130796 RepID=A0ABS5AMI6_9PSEU|nr:response regulator transcription factor [Crossiella equi]MBP2477414.1 DNA-binding NarL/FixJ family response regulator [Crossiella equi]